MKPPLLLFFLCFLTAVFSPAQSNPPQPLAFRIGSVRFDRPEGWSYSRPTDGILAAQLEKKTDGAPLRITFARLASGSIGTVSANVDRWQGQFLSRDSAPRIETLTGTTLPLTLVKLAGTMKGGVPGGPPNEAPDTLLLGAILDSPEGLVAVKLVGPQKMVGLAEPVFMELVKSAAGRKP